MKGKLTRLLALASIACFVFACTSERQPAPLAKQKPVAEPSKPFNHDLKQIQSSGVLKVLMGFSSTNYFIYKGKPMGYEYELLTRLAQHLNVVLDIVPVRNMDKIFEKLNRGDGDIIAHGLAVTKARKKEVSFCDYHSLTQQVLIQKKPTGWRKMKLHQIEKQLIRNPIHLIGRKIYVRENSAYFQRLVHLSEEIGDDIDIQIVPGEVSTEALIRQVASGSIELTIADKNIAALSKTYMSNLDIQTSISFPQRIAWAVRKNSPMLLQSVNQWLNKMKSKPDMYVIRNRYFNNPKAHRIRIKSDFFSKTGGKISPFDPKIKAHAKTLQWDWRLLASLIYQESQFNPSRKSWAGAMGLMQIMPRTAKRYGLTDYYNPEKNMEAGVQHLKHLQQTWKGIPDSTNRLKFILAAYNAGTGHVADAQRLAHKYGKNPDQWDGHVAEYLLLKSEPGYYNDKIVRYGFLRGHETYNYVRNILIRYGHYMKNIPDTPQSSMYSSTPIPKG